jgi:non-specific serine/threonine protein kinase
LGQRKNKLLQIYGYNLDDDLKGKFEFIYKDGKPFLKVLDTSIKRVAQTIPAPKPAYMQDTGPWLKRRKQLRKREQKNWVLFLILMQLFISFRIDAIQGDVDETNNRLLGKVEKLDLTKYVNTELFSEGR